METKYAMKLSLQNLVHKYQTSGNYFIRFIIYLSIVSFILLPTSHLHFTITNEFTKTIVGMSTALVTVAYEKV